MSFVIARPASSRPLLLSGRKLDAAVWTALVATVLVLAHPYAGIVHDGILYFAQAMARIRPDVYGGDVYFKWGSQDRYSLFSPLYSQAILHFGVERANFFLVLLSQALFLAGSFMLVRRLLEPPLAAFAMLMISATNGVYGGYFIFRMAEPFVTPRAFAEAATLFAVALLCDGRRLGAFAVLLAATLLHPLVALVGWAFAWIYLIMHDRRWAWAALLAVPGVLAALAGVEPFAQLARRFDPVWLEALVSRNQHVFLLEWTRYDWFLLACDFSIAAVAFALVRGVARRVLASAMALAGLGLVATFVGADLLHNVLLTNLQLWRTLWLLHWMSAAFVPYIAWRMWRESSVGQLIVALALLGFVFRGLPSGVGACALMALLFAYRDRIVLRSAFARPALFALLAAAMGNWLVTLPRSREIALFAAQSPTLEYIVRTMTKPFVLVVLGSAIAFWLLRGPRPWQKAALAVVLVAVAVSLWDQRDPMKRYVESAEMGAHPFSRFVQTDQEVFWHGDVVAPWILMERRSYLSAAQQAGQMFNRGTAIELERRSAAVKILDFQEQLCLLVNAINNRSDACTPDLDALRSVCQEARDLDFVVLGSRIGDRALASWSPPIPFTYRRPNFYLYDCKNLASR